MPWPSAEAVEATAAKADGVGGTETKGTAKQRFCHYTKRLMQRKKKTEYLQDYRDVRPPLRPPLRPSLRPSLTHRQSCCT